MLYVQLFIDAHVAYLSTYLSKYVPSQQYSEGWLILSRDPVGPGHVSCAVGPEYFCLLHDPLYLGHGLWQFCFESLTPIYLINSDAPLHPLGSTTHSQTQRSGIVHIRQLVILFSQRCPDQIHRQSFYSPGSIRIRRAMSTPTFSLALLLVILLVIRKSYYSGFSKAQRICFQFGLVFTLIAILIEIWLAVFGGV